MNNISKKNYLKKILNQIAENDYDRFTICGKYMLTETFDPITMIDKIEIEKPLRILINEKLLKYIKKDKRVKLVDDNIINISGNWGTICGAKFSCYSHQFVDKEYKILLYKNNDIKCSSIIVFYK